MIWFYQHDRSTQFGALPASMAAKLPRTSAAPATVWLNGASWHTALRARAAKKRKVFVGHCSYCMQGQASLRVEAVASGVKNLRKVNSLDLDGLWTVTEAAAWRLKPQGRDFVNADTVPLPPAVVKGSSRTTLGKTFFQCAPQAIL